jgi:hypothetical protein
MIGPVDLLVQSNLLAAINFSGVGSFTPDVLELYDISDLKSPVLVSAAGFPVNKLSNANRIGQVIMTSNYVFALDGNNGMLAFRLSGPTPPIIDSISLQAQNTLLMNFSGEPWFGYDLLGSTNLADWFVVTNLTAAGNGQFQFSTTIPTNSPTQFFRLR